MNLVFNIDQTAIFCRRNLLRYRRDQVHAGALISSGGGSLRSRSHLLQSMCAVWLSYCCGPLVKSLWSRVPLYLLTRGSEAKSAHLKYVFLSFPALKRGKPNENH